MVSWRELAARRRRPGGRALGGRRAAGRPGRRAGATVGGSDPGGLRGVARRRGGRRGGQGTRAAGHAPGAAQRVGAPCGRAALRGSWPLARWGCPGRGFLSVTRPAWVSHRCRPRARSGTSCGSGGRRRGLGCRRPTRTARWSSPPAQPGRPRGSSTGTARWPHSSTCSGRRTRSVPGIAWSPLSRRSRCWGRRLGIATVVPDIDVTAPHTLTARRCCRGGQRRRRGTVVFASPAALRNVVATTSSQLSSWSTGRVGLGASPASPPAPRYRLDLLRRDADHAAQRGRRTRRTA